ncbi:hypothetical protein BB559_003180 [Furculomyces boomerangus]|uniref:Large ribosomal subunit protein mL67 n=2 Tax=Harpellales TaxID=61421 RepID=A0A2T9YN21_9FUNG|nr:hypothetical protein BB559_003180 [Furculomyces boomerangus]PWA00853.1 hypothetical protein BB558_003084 [Smittium angustum]
MENLAIYLFRNLKTKQVLVSKSSNFLNNNQLLKQFTNNAIKPLLVRPDMWSPMVVLHGFKSIDLQNNMFSLLSTPVPPPETVIQRSGISLEEYKRFPLEKKREFERNMIEPKLDQLCRAILFLNYKKIDYSLTLFWENYAFMNSITRETLKWPENISHKKLDLVKGNMILNPELRKLSKIKI